jgi:hypothetical protein
MRRDARLAACRAGQAAACARHVVARGRPCEHAAGFRGRGPAPADRRARNRHGGATRRADRADHRRGLHRAVRHARVREVEARAQGRGRRRAAAGGAEGPPHAHRGGHGPGRKDHRHPGRPHHRPADDAAFSQRRLRRRHPHGGAVAVAADRRHAARRGARDAAGAGHRAVRRRCAANRGRRHARGLGALRRAAVECRHRRMAWPPAAEA